MALMPNGLTYAVSVTSGVIYQLRTGDEHIRRKQVQQGSRDTTQEHMHLCASCVHADNDEITLKAPDMTGPGCLWLSHARRSILGRCLFQERLGQRPQILLFRYTRFGGADLPLQATLIIVVFPGFMCFVP